MKLEVATWIAFCLYVTGTESLVKSQHTETGGANSCLEKLQPEKKKKAQILLVWSSSGFSFTTVRTTESTTSLVSAVYHGLLHVWHHPHPQCERSCWFSATARRSVSREEWWGGESSTGPKAKPCGIPLLTYRLSTPPSYFIYAVHTFF